jgi:glycosyltransferase involved in cell wall biosynthesis
MIRVAITAYLRGNDWLGGMNYFRSLVNALRKYPALDEFAFSVLTNRPEKFGDQKAGNVYIVNAPWLDSTSRTGYFLNAAIKTTGFVNPMLYRYAKTSGIDLITHSTVGFFNACPTLFWMQDFQHCYYPKYFSLYERARRNRNVRISLRTGHILFSSYSAAADFRHFFPHLCGVQAHVLQFTPLVYENEKPLTRNELEFKYNLQGDYFFLPNQFWQHKNHMVVIEAMHRLPATFQVVSTGQLSDSRDNAHISEIMARIKQYSLGNRFRLLGVVPRVDLLGLMHHASCVINPSLFEGWSSTVEEAKYLGKRVLLSDIPVHREQDPTDAIFFSPLDPDELAHAMERVKDGYDQVQEQKRIEKGKSSYESSIERFSNQYRSIAKKILSLGD